MVSLKKKQLQSWIALINNLVPSTSTNHGSPSSVILAMKIVKLNHASTSSSGGLKTQVMASYIKHLAYLIRLVLQELILLLECFTECNLEITKSSKEGFLPHNISYKFWDFGCSNKWSIIQKKGCVTKRGKINYTIWHNMVQRKLIRHINKLREKKKHPQWKYRNHMGHRWEVVMSVITMVMFEFRVGAGLHQGSAPRPSICLVTDNLMADV